MKKIIDKKRSIGTVADELGVRTHVIRFWEEKFSQIKPQIGKGDRRYYFNDQVAVLKKIKSLLHDEGYSIAGLQKLLNKRKKSDLKENNLEFLRAKDVQNID
ncbi:MAG: DNA-binding transcriptional MerR regulator, partial [Rickettsiales bacterium]